MLSNSGSINENTTPHLLVTSRCRGFVLMTVTVIVAAENRLCMTLMSKSLATLLFHKWFQLPTQTTWKLHIIGTHYNDVIMGMIASEITSLTSVYSTVYSDADQRKHQSSASSHFVRGIHWGPVNSSHKWPVTRKMVPFSMTYEL